MSILHSASLSIRYYRKRTVVLFLIFVCIFTVFFVVFLTWNSSKTQIDYLQSNLGNSITISKVLQQDLQTPSLFTKQDIKTMKEIPLVMDLNMITTNTFLLKNASPCIEDPESYERYKKKNEAALAAFGIEDAETNCRLFAMTDSEKLPFFTGGGFKLIRGRTITAADRERKLALISKRLAEENKLEVGDSITVSLDDFRISMGMSSEELTFEIIGFFSDPVLGRGEGRAEESSANYLFVPEAILAEEYWFYPEIVYAYTSNSTDMPDLVSQLKKALPDGSTDPQGNPAVYEYNWDPEWVESVSGPLTEVNRLCSTILLIISCVMLMLTALIGALLIYKRTYEYYIYRSRGESRKNIVVQSLIEYMVPILAGGILAFGLSACAERTISTIIMKPYVSLYDTYLQEYKDHAELVRETTDIMEGLRRNDPGIRNLNWDIPLQLDFVSILVFLGVLFVVIPMILAVEILIFIRGNSIRLNASNERS
ncbi:MAG: ABC transporter permease [Lachnospiraceae bacterium]